MNERQKDLYGRISHAYWYPGDRDGYVLFVVEGWAKHKHRYKGHYPSIAVHIRTGTVYTVVDGAWSAANVHLNWMVKPLILAAFPQFTKEDMGFTHEDYP